METLDPVREQLLSDRPEPKLTISNTDKEDASRTIPYADTDDPKREKLRTEKALPK
jgi:hypothetical protein